MEPARERGVVIEVNSVLVAQPQAELLAQERDEVVTQFSESTPYGCNTCKISA